MSKLEDILTNLSATVFCLGQDDGNPFMVDKHSDQAKEEVKQLIIQISLETLSDPFSEQDFMDKVENL